ncbi:MAG: RHS repeat-associated core domain-containing protein [Candidatus Binataceae bacterium]
MGNLTYGYDADGRVTSKNGTLAAINLPTAASGNSFNADNGMTAFNGTTLSYDANGNLTGDGTNTYTWDARNHLTAISGPVDASFTYDAFGRRASKTIAGTGTQFLYDILNPVQELQAGTPSGNLLDGLNIDEYFARTDSNNNLSTLLEDALGSTIGLVGAGQSIATSYIYQPFGATTTTGAANGNSYQFTGRENDGTGLYFYRARYYNPMYQRFIAQDPLGFAGGDLDLYGYVHQDPVNHTDPSGLCGNKPCHGTALIIAGNADTIGTPGGFSGHTVGDIDVTANSAAVDPTQWGGKATLRGVLSQISGQTPAGASFSGVSDVIGGEPPGSWTEDDSALDYFAYTYPNDLLIELPSLPKQTPFETPITINVPLGFPCPEGTN